jgi:lauroyl/myristoyl acyltransferase
LIRAFEADISEHPTDWHMLQPIWVADNTSARLPEVARR